MDAEIITLTSENIDGEHICCAIGNDNTSQRRALEKKEWLKQQIPHGFIYKKANVRGKVFIEYVPAENAWKPVDAPGYNLINCFWVSGRYKGQGYGRLLMEECINDSIEKNGLVVVTSRNKMPWLVDKKLFQKFGFETCDEAPPYFELLVRKNNQAARNPSFRESAKKGTIDDTNGVVIMYSHQCPFHEDFVNLMLDTARNIGFEAKKIRIDNQDAAQNVPYANGLVAVYLNGKFLKHEITTSKRFEKILSEYRP